MTKALLRHLHGTKHYTNTIPTPTSMDATLPGNQLQASTGTAVLLPADHTPQQELQKGNAHVQQAQPRHTYRPHSGQQLAARQGTSKRAQHMDLDFSTAKTSHKTISTHLRTVYLEATGGPTGPRDRHRPTGPRAHGPTGPRGPATSPHVCDEM